MFSCHIEAAPGSGSGVQRVAFEDLAKNTFQITISRVQQEALKYAGSKVPTPSEQLALVAARRKKKHETSHNCIWICYEYIVFLHQLIPSIPSLSI